MPSEVFGTAMAPSSGKVPAPRHDTAIRELTRGFELTRRLRVLLRQMPHDDIRRDAAGVLSLEVLRSLTVALCCLESPDEASPLSQPPDHCGWTDSEGQMTSEAAGEERRGRPEKLEKRSEHSRTEITATPYLDGHQWRKYGQKSIAGAKFSRSYYRCTYSDVDGCKATKQVQQAERGQNEPRMFRVRYSNEHTCRNRLIAPSIGSCSLELIERTTKGTSQMQAWVNFGISNPGRCEEAPLLSFSSSSSSDQDEDGAPNRVLPSNCSCCECLASLGTVFQASMTRPDGDQSLTNSKNIIKQDVVSGGLEDELLGCEFFFQLDPEDV